MCMKRNNVYDIAKSWAIFSVLTYHVINIIYYNQPIITAMLFLGIKK